MYTFEDYSPTSSTLMNNNNCNVFNIAAVNYNNNNNNNNNNTTEILPQPLLSLQSPSLFSPILNQPFDANDFVMPHVEEDAKQHKEKEEIKASNTEPLLDLTEYTLQIDYTEILFILQNGETTKLSFDLMEHLCPHLTSQLKDSNVIRNAYLQLIEDGKFNTHSNLTIINKEEKCVKAFPIIYLKNLSTLTMNCFLKAIQLATMIEYNWKFKKLKENDLKIKLNVSSGDLRNLFLLYLILFNYEWNQCNALDCIIRSVYFVSSSMNQLYFARTTLNNIEFPFVESLSDNCVVDNSTTNGMSISSTSCAPRTIDMNTQNIINNNNNSNNNYNNNNCIPMWCCINEKQFNERKEKIIKYFDGKINTNFFKNYIGLDIELYHTLQPFNILKEQERLNQSCAWSYFDWSFIHHILTSSDLVVEINKKETQVLAAVGSFIHNNREEILRTYQEAISLQQLLFYNNTTQNYTQQNNNNIYTTEEVLDSIYFLFSCVKWKLLKDRSQETDLSYFHNYLQILFKTEINIQEMKDKILYFSDQFYSQHYDKTLIERNFKKTNVTNFTMNLSGKMFLKPQINQKQYPSGIEINYNQDELLNEFLNFHKTKEGKELRLNTFKKFILNDFRSFIGNVLPKNYREVIVGYSNGVMNVGGGNGNNNQTGGCCGNNFNSNSNNKSVVVNNGKVKKVMKFIPLKTDNNNNNTSEVNANKQLKKKKVATNSKKKDNNNNNAVENNANCHNNNKRKKNEETIIYDTSKRRNSAPDTSVMPTTVTASPNKTNKCILAPPRTSTATTANSTATKGSTSATTDSNGNNNNNNTFCFVFETGMSSTTFSSKSKRRASACNSLLTKTTNKKKGNNSVKKNITKVIEENQEQEEELKRKCSNNSSSFVNVIQPQQLQQQVFNNNTNNINHLNNNSMIFSFNNNVYSPENNQAISSINSNINNQNINNNIHNDINSQNNNQEPLLFDPSLLNQYEFPNTNNTTYNTYNSNYNNSAVNNNNNSTFDFLASPTYSLFENNNQSSANNNNNNTSCSSSNNNNEMTILQYDQQFNLLNQQQQQNNNFDEFLNFNELFNDSISYTTNNNNDNNNYINNINNNNTNFNNNVASSSSSTTTNNTTTVNANNVIVNNNNNNESGKDPATSVFNYGFGVFIPTYFSIPDLNNNIQVTTLGDDELSYL